MEHFKSFMSKSTLVLTGIILASFILAALGGVIESVYLVYFWYLGLVTIGLLMIISLLGGLMLLVNGCCKWGHRQNHVWNGRAVSLF